MQHDDMPAYGHKAREHKTARSARTLRLGAKPRQKKNEPELQTTF